MSGTIPAMVQESAQRFGSDTAIVDGSRRISYAELGRLAVEATRAALASGVGPGSRVGLWAPNSADWIVATLGVQGAGGTVVPLGTRLRGDEVARALRRTGAALLFSAGAFLGADLVAMLRAADPDWADAAQREIVVLGDPIGGATPWAGFLARADAVSEQDAVRSIRAVAPDDIADIIFTSGTTGVPKGVMSAHRQNLGAFAAFNEGFGLRHGDVQLVLNPFSHTFGYKAGWMLSLQVGATVLPMAVADVDACLRLAAQERVTVLPGAPALLAALLDAPVRAELDLTALRMTLTGATTVPDTLVRRLWAELFEVVVVGYGLTEASGIVATTSAEDPVEVVAHTVGRAIAGVEVAIVDTDGAALAAGEVGEIVVRGFNVMRGYLDDPVATAEAVRDGWLWTGDIGRLDEHGNLSIVDRRKDMFIVGGFNVYPAEVEKDLLRSGLLADVAVIGAPDERLGEVGVAFAVSPAGAPLDVDDLLGWARDHMAGYKVPRHVRVVDTLPRNASNKVLKNDLRKELSL